MLRGALNVFLAAAQVTKVARSKLVKRTGVYGFHLVTLHSASADQTIVGRHMAAQQQWGTKKKTTNRASTAIASKNLFPSRDSALASCHPSVAASGSEISVGAAGAFVFIPAQTDFYFTAKHRTRQKLSRNLLSLRRRLPLLFSWQGDWKWLAGAAPI